MRPARTLAGILAPYAAALAVACAHSAPHAPDAAPRSATRADSAATAPISLRVESHNSSDVIIYAGAGRMRQRLGTVIGTTTNTFTIPARFTADGTSFYLVAHRVGGGAGGDLVSPTVSVQPGQTVIWTLESKLPSSSLSIE